MFTASCKSKRNESAVISIEASWRLRSILRTRRHFCANELMQLYKSLVLSYVESYTPAIYHAAPSTLFRIDRIQDRLLERLGISISDALFRFSLAPLASRRDMALLGLLHKVAHGTAPLEVCRLFPAAPRRLPAPYPLRVGFHLTRFSHKRQLATTCERNSTERFKRSIYNLVHVWNALPESASEIVSTKDFQHRIQLALKRNSSSSSSWPILYKTGWKSMQCNTFDNLFWKPVDETEQVPVDAEPLYPESSDSDQ